MIKTLIVDDEQYVLDGFKECVDWERFGMSIVGEANNGQEALAFIERQAVDVIFTDVRMPMMNGIELIAKLHEDGCKAKVIILSGYEDFEYARSAIQYNAFEYLLKPATMEKIEETLRKLVEAFEQEQVLKEQADVKEKALLNARPYIEEKVLRNLLNDQIDEEMMKAYDIQVMSRACTLVKIQLDKSRLEDRQKMSDSALADTMKQVAAVIELSLKVTFDCKLISYGIGTLVMFVFTDMTAGDLKKEIARVQAAVMIRTGYSISSGIGRCATSYEDIATSYMQASEALAHKLYYGINSVIVFDEIRRIIFDGIRDLGDWKKALTEAMTNLDLLRATEVIHKNIQTIKESGGYNIEYIRQLSMEMLLTISLTLTEQFSELESIYNDKRNLLNYILELETLEEINQVITDVCAKTIEYLQNQEASSTNSIVAGIKRYLEENMDKNISLEAIAEEVYLTPNYIGHLFKEEVGMNYLDYLTQIRMEKAKALLKEPKNKIYEVSLQVGHNNPNYFSKLFKKYTGYTPSQYKSYMKS